MKTKSVNFLYAIVMLILLITMSTCNITPTDLPWETPPNPINLTADDIDFFGEFGSDETDLYEPIDMDISTVGAVDWLVVADKTNKNIMRTRLPNFTTDGTTSGFIGTRVDYENEGVPYQISSDTSGDIYTVSTRTISDILEIRLIKYELDVNGKPNSTKTWEHTIYTDYDTTTKITYEDEEYQTYFSNITKMDIINADRISLSNHSTYSFTTSDSGTLTVPGDTTYNTRKVRNITIADPPAVDTDIWGIPYAEIDIESMNEDDQLNSTVLDVYTIHNAALNSENVYVLYIDNYVNIEKRINPETGKEEDTKVGKGIMKIVSYNASTELLDTTYTFIGDGTHIDSVSLTPTDNVDIEDYQFYYKGWLSDAKAIALDGTGNNLFILKYVQGYVMCFEKNAGTFEFKNSIDIRVALENENLSNPSDIEYYESGADNYIIILDKDNSRVVRVKIN